MMHRRGFLAGLAALAGGPALLTAGGPAGREQLEDAAHRQYLADLADCDMRTLGVPRNPSLVVQGFHPVTPDRVLVVDDADLRRMSRRHRGLKRLFREKETRWRLRCPSDPPLTAKKLDLCVGLMERLTAHYGRPNLFLRWAKTLWSRELLASTGIGHGLCLLHDFQHHDDPVRTDNEVVDWWLVLLPGGVDWQAMDDWPVHYMVGPVMEERLPGDYLRVMEAMARGLRPLVLSAGFDPGNWSARLAGLPAAEAAREFNFVVAAGLCRTARG